MLEAEQQQQEAGGSGGDSSQTPAAENLPPLESGTDPISAAESAGAALLQVKAAEVQTLADVLTRLNEKEGKLDSLISRMESAVSSISDMQVQAQMALAEIQDQQQAEKAKAETQTPATVNGKRGLATLIR